MSSVSIINSTENYNQKNQRTQKIISSIMIAVSVITSLFIFLFPFGTYPSYGYMTIVVEIGLLGSDIGQTRIISTLICVSFLSSFLLSILELLLSIGKISPTKLPAFIALYGNIIFASLSLTLTISLAIIIPPLSTAPTGSWDYTITLYFSLIGSLFMLISSFVIFKYSIFSKIYTKTNRV
ncbi:MAG: hypothetical protein JXA54_09820 [Candidatus Heimdallarchaeota archaeon]|nr:hypothetical protein [Candidatus Heimdallarchaeota archaeon]